MYSNLILLSDFAPIKQDYSLLIITGIFLLSIVLILIGVIDLFGKKFKDNTKKIFWLLAIILTGGFATVLYLLSRNKLIIKEESNILDYEE